MTDTLRNMPRYIRNTDAFGWQGADGPNGPWRPITPPQSGTPWQPGSPMDDLRQASADVSGVELEPGWRQETANKLSPAALSVWCRFCEVVEEHGPPRLGLAAALRAAAQQLPGVRWNGCIQPDAEISIGINWSRDALHTLADQLERAGAE